MHPNIIPHGMDAYPQFILCKVIPDLSKPGKTEKVPCDVHGTKINAHDRSRWMSAAVALELAARHGLRVGFVFSASDPFWCIDLDSVLNRIANAWNAHSLAVMARFPGCAVEVSNSGEGLHLFGSGDVPEHASKNPAGNVEFYTAGRFILLTGTGASGSALTDFTAAMPAFIAAYGLEPKPGPDLEAIRATGVAPGANPYQDDAELIRKMCESTGSARVNMGAIPHPRDLWNGNAEVLGRFYPHASNPWDRSRADAALVAALCFWTGGDVGRIERLFLQSTIARPDHYARRPALMVRVLGIGCRGITKFHDKDYSSRGAALDGTRAAAGEVISTVQGAGYVPTPVAPLVRIIPCAPLVLRAEQEIQPRMFLYGRHYIRRETSATYSPGGVGKTALTFVEMLAMLTGFPLLGEGVKRPLRVIYFGEEGIDEIDRRMIAACKHYGIDWATAVGDRFIRHSLRDEPLTLIERKDRSFAVNERDVNAVKALILEHRADVVIFDTMKKTHQLNENDNGEMDALIAQFNVISEHSNCSIMLLAHTRKASQFGGDGIESARGGRAQLDALRSARLIVRMTTDEAKEMGIAPDKTWQHIRIGDTKENMAPPPDKTNWFKLTSVTLDNHRPFDPDNHSGPDNVQTVTRYMALKHVENMTDDKLTEIRKACAARYREDPRSPEWVGHPLGRVMDIDSRDAHGKKQLMSLVRQLVKDHVFEIQDEMDTTQRKLKSYIRVVNSFEESAPVTI